jgi:hypothetical protein
MGIPKEVEAIPNRNTSLNASYQWQFTPEENGKDDFFLTLYNPNGKNVAFITYALNMDGELDREMYQAQIHKAGFNRMPMVTKKEFLSELALAVEIICGATDMPIDSEP